MVSGAGRGGCPPRPLLQSSITHQSFIRHQLCSRPPSESPTRDAATCREGGGGVHVCDGPNGLGWARYGRRCRESRGP